MEHESVKRLWEAYKKENPDAPEKYDAWAFGDTKEMADELAALVVAGTKTATASNYLLYGEEPLSAVGLHNIILNGDGEAVAVAVTTAVDIIPFDEVTEEFAFLEGEGDRSLAYWRRVHEDFFTREMQGTEYKFHEKMPVVCEKFQVVYKEEGL